MSSRMNGGDVPLCQFGPGGEFSRTWPATEESLPLREPHRRPALRHISSGVSEILRRLGWTADQVDFPAASLCLLTTNRGTLKPPAPMAHSNPHQIAVHGENGWLFANVENNASVAPRKGSRSSRGRKAYSGTPRLGREAMLFEM